MGNRYDGQQFLFAVYATFVPIVWIISLPIVWGSYDGQRFLFVMAFQYKSFAFLPVLESSSFCILKRRSFLLVCPFRRSYSPRIE